MVDVVRCVREREREFSRSCVFMGEGGAAALLLFWRLICDSQHTATARCCHMGGSILHD